MKRVAVGVPALIFLLAAWLFVGIERIPDEHNVKHEVFMKQRPTFQLVFRNPVTCGVCDSHPYELLTAAEKTEFGTFCWYRFGLDHSNECYAIFAEQQRASTAAIAK